MANTLYHIMVVEDDKILCQHLKAGLEKEGYQVVIAHNGADAVRQFSHQFLTS